MAVVGDPFLVEVRFAFGDSAGDGLAVDLGGPLPVRAVGLGRITMAAAARRAASVVTGRDAAGRDEPDVGQLTGEFAVTAFVAG